mgnify:CR=1 FL=1
MYTREELANKAEVSVQKIKEYEDEDYFHSTCNFITGNHYYNDSKPILLSFLQCLEKKGMSHEEIWEVLNGTKSKEIERLEKENYIKSVDFSIISGNYRDYVKWNGKKDENSIEAHEIKCNNAKYYIILDEDRFYGDFLVYYHENTIFENSLLVCNDVLFKNVIDYLKGEGYLYITYYEYEKEKTTIQYLKDKYLAEVIEDNVLFGNILFVKLKIVL